jgi:hypothetical protein
MKYKKTLLCFSVLLIVAFVLSWLSVRNLSESEATEATWVSSSAQKSKQQGTWEWALTIDKDQSDPEALSVPISEAWVEGVVETGRLFHLIPINRRSTKKIVAIVLPRPEGSPIDFFSFPEKRTTVPIAKSCGISQVLVVTIGFITPSSTQNRRLK